VAALADLKNRNCRRHRLELVVAQQEVEQLEEVLEREAAVVQQRKDQTSSQAGLRSNFALPMTNFAVEQELGFVTVD